MATWSWHRLYNACTAKLHATEIVRNHPWKWLNCKYHQQVTNRWPRWHPVFINVFLLFIFGPYQCFHCSAEAFVNEKNHITSKGLQTQKAGKINRLSKKLSWSWEPSDCVWPACTAEPSIFSHSPHETGQLTRTHWHSSYCSLETLPLSLYDLWDASSVSLCQIITFTHH